MIKLILTVIGNIILKWLGMEKEKQLESENEALKGRSESVEDSYSEQDKARKEAEKAKEEVEKQGDGKDIFGAKEWNGEDGDGQENTTES